MAGSQEQSLRKLLRKLLQGFARSTPEELSLNSRGCARPERTPGIGGRNVHHPGGVAPCREPWMAWNRGNPAGVRERCGGAPGVSLVPRATPGYSMGTPPGFARGMPAAD